MANVITGSLWGLTSETQVSKDAISGVFALVATNVKDADAPLGAPADLVGLHALIATSQVAAIQSGGLFALAMISSRELEIPKETGQLFTQIQR